MKKFIFKNYGFDKNQSMAFFNYGFDDGRDFCEKISFKTTPGYNEQILDKALFLAFIIIGTSYYKTFPTNQLVLNFSIDQFQADFFSKVYQEGLGQFAYENKLTRNDLAKFTKNVDDNKFDSEYNGFGVLALQSGGKDSLLTACLLNEKNINFTAWYATSSDQYPSILNQVSQNLIVSKRIIDKDSLDKARLDGGINGHIPVTYIIQSLALIQAILINASVVVTSIAHEGEEPHAYIDDLPVMHQWSKTWDAEKAFSEYISKYISSKLLLGSPLRAFSEMRIAEMFVEHAWVKYGHSFSSCNVANYKQGALNNDLKWCCNCPKCANSYLLFSPFLVSTELKSIFNDQDLFEKENLRDTFKGLLGVDGVMKPFECVGEIEELRLAYQRSQKYGEYKILPFDVPITSFDYLKQYPAQDWAVKMIQ